MSLNWYPVGNRSRNKTQQGQIPKTKLKEYRHNQTLAGSGQLWAFSSDSGPTFAHPAAQGVITPSAVLQPAKWQNGHAMYALYFLDFLHFSPRFENFWSREITFFLQMFSLS